MYSECMINGHDLAKGWFKHGKGVVQKRYPFLIQLSFLAPSIFTKKLDYNWIFK